VKNNTVSPTVQDPFVKTFELQATQIAGQYQDRLRELSKAHRRERYIDWIGYGDDPSFFALVTEEYAMRGEREPDSVSSEEYREIIGRHFDRLEDDGIAAFERQVRAEDKNLYFDDHYYSDEMIALRWEWGDEISKLAGGHTKDLGERYLQEISNPLSEEEWAQARNQHELSESVIVKTRIEHSPSIFNCDACGEHSYTHDETGALIAGVGLWALTTGGTAQYIICEECNDKPEETSRILSRLFAEREAFWKHEDEESERRIEALCQQAQADIIDDLADALRNAHTGSQSTTTGNTGSGQAAGNVGGSQSTQSSSGQQSGAFSFLSFDELLILPSKTWLIDQVIGPRDKGMLFGEPSSGKTFLGIDLSFAACLGQKWAGQFDIPRPLSVVYCAGEGVAGLRDRFDVAKDFWQVATLPNFTIIPSTPQLFVDPGGLNDISIAAFVKAWQAKQSGCAIDLLIIDTYHTATVGSEENSSKDAGKVLHHLQDAINTLQCAVLLIHHTDKNGVNYRGSSALHGGMDAMFKAKSGAVNSTLECTKLKDGARWKDKSYRILAKGSSARVEWNPAPFAGATQQVIALRDRILDMLRADPAKRLTVAQMHAQMPDEARATVKDTLDALCSEKRVHKQKMGKAKTSPYEYWLDDAMDAALDAIGR
jgi:hypothetical protein